MCDRCRITKNSAVVIEAADEVIRAISQPLFNSNDSLLKSFWFFRDELNV